MLRLQFSLRSFLAVMFVLAAVMAWLGHTYQRHRHPDETSKPCVVSGAYLTYHHRR